MICYFVTLHSKRCEALTTCPIALYFAVLTAPTVIPHTQGSAAAPQSCDSSMGQFQSKEYDGDPYVDLMRALPERELIWWVQKAIWVSYQSWQYRLVGMLRQQQ